MSAVPRKPTLGPSALSADVMDPFSAQVSLNRSRAYIAHAPMVSRGIGPRSHRRVATWAAGGLPSARRGAKIFPVMDTLDIALRLGAATLVGVVLGLNRDLHGKSTGVRTLGVLCLGSALAVLSIHAVTVARRQPRDSCGIVTGVGFLGAGVIVRSEKGHHVQGLTTAAVVLGYRMHGCGLRSCPVADRGDRRCSRLRHSRVWRAFRESDRSAALAVATDCGSAARHNAR